MTSNWSTRQHAVPPQSAPDWLGRTDLAGPNDSAGCVGNDSNTLKHSRLRNVLAFGDAGSSPGSKTGAAIRKQVSVVDRRLEAAIAGKPLPGSYDGFACSTAKISRVLRVRPIRHTVHPVGPADRHQIQLNRRFRTGLVRGAQPTPHRRSAGAGRRTGSGG